MECNCSFLFLQPISFFLPVVAILRVLGAFLIFSASSLPPAQQLPKPVLQPV